MLKFKNIAISLVLILLIVCSLNLDCNATECAYRLTYEQLTKKYPSMEQYIAETRKCVKDNWYPPVKSFQNKATIILTINKQGELLNCYISEPSSDDGFDSSLIDAAKKAKYSPLPDEVTDDSLDIDLTFNMKKRGIKNSLILKSDNE